MRSSILLTAALMCLPLVSAAQMPDSRVPEIRPFVGAFLPTGDSRPLLKDAFLAGTSFGYELGERFHLVGTLGWSPNREKPAVTGNRLDLFAYTLGIEWQRARGVPGDTWVRPFLGMGAGGTTFHLRQVQVDARTYLAGYGSAGLEVQTDKVGLRLEARDYLHQFKGIQVTEKATVRNFVMVMAGLSYHIW